MHDPMLELLFSEYRRKVLSLLFIEPGRAFHVREIARRTATQAGTLHKELSRLAEGGILLRQRQGNQICYQANVDCLTNVAIKATKEQARKAIQPMGTGHYQIE